VVRPGHEPEPVADSGHDPARLVEEAEEQARCNRAIGLLTPEEQRLWELRTAGFTLGEMAHQLGISVATVKRRLDGVGEKIGLALHSA
jgi:RNA polymerase sigma factor (sigma-70 family)